MRSTRVLAAAVAVTAACAASSSAAQLYYTNAAAGTGVNGAWNNPGNWSTTQAPAPISVAPAAPGAADEAVIAYAGLPNGNYDVQLTAAQDINKVTVTSAATAFEPRIISTPSNRLMLGSGGISVGASGSEPAPTSSSILFNLRIENTRVVANTTVHVEGGATVNTAGGGSYALLGSANKASPFANSTGYFLSDGDIGRLLVTKTGTGGVLLSGTASPSGNGSVGNNWDITNGVVRVQSTNINNTLGLPSSGSVDVFTIRGDGRLLLMNGATFNSATNFVVGPSAGTGGGTIDVNTGQTITIQGQIKNNGAGAGQLRLNTGSFAGTIVVDGFFNHTGGTLIDKGTLRLNASNRLPDAGPLTIGSAAFLDLARNDTNTFSDLVGGLNGSGVIGLGGDGTSSVLSVGGNNEDGVFNGFLRNVLSQDVASPTRFFSLRKVGSGTQVLGPTITSGSTILSGGYVTSGSVTIDNGTLQVDGLFPNNSQVNVNGGGTLTGTGAMRNVVVNANGTVAPGTAASAGTFTVNANGGGLTLDAAGILSYNLSAASLAVGGGVNDLLQVNGDLLLDGTLNLASVLNGTVLSEGVYRLINYTGSLTNDTLDLGSGFSPLRTYSIDVSVPGQVNLVVVPEPSTLAGLVAAATVLLGRRRRA
jgi:hypothetical protein